MPEVSSVSRTAGIAPGSASESAAPPVAALADIVREVFSQGGGLSRALHEYEPRDGQRRMADAVAAIAADGGILLAEAGTGTGKTLAYLVPAILSGRRVLISTGTKNLQEQIFFKDLPTLEAALGARISATLMKGRANYLCLHRWEVYQQSLAGDETPQRALPHWRASDRLAERHLLLPLVDEWARRTQTGDRAELRDLPDELPFWNEIAAHADTCLGSDCPRHSDCFVTRMRQHAAESDVVIVNHHLLCADAAVRQSAYGEVIPECSTLVIDEAHQLEDVATQYFGYAVSNFRVDELVADGNRLLRARPFGEKDEDVHRALARIERRAGTFFNALAMALPAAGERRQADQSGTRTPQESRVRYTAEAMAEHFEDGMALAGAIEGLETTVASLLAGAGDAAGAAVDPVRNETEAAAALQRRAIEIRSDLRFLIRASDPDFVYFLEARPRSLLLRAAPIDVSRIIHQALFDRIPATVLTSATLAVDGSFAYIKMRLGIGSAREIRVASDFNYATQALLYLPRRMPPPKAATFPDAAAREVAEILTRSSGRAFVLFTSYAVLRHVQRVLGASLPYPILVQGAAPPTELLDRFRRTPNAVLLATSSFWQGVDVAGEALSCVIIDKLPFASPADPVTAARIEAVAAAGGNPFDDYQVPLAILALQQGLGRLIRHRADRGVLAVLDPRLRTMGYGRRFLASLPPAPITHELDAVGRFFV